MNIVHFQFFNTLIKIMGIHSILHIKTFIKFIHLLWFYWVHH